MPKNLLIMRHGQAEPTGQGIPDKDRALTHQGRSRSMDVGKALKNKGIIPQIAFCSQAVRAIETANCVLAALDSPENGTTSPLVRVEEFFSGAADHFVAEIGALPASIDTVLVVAHNPWISDMVSVLSGQMVELAPGDLALLETREPTGDQGWPALVTVPRQWRLESV